MRCIHHHLLGIQAQASVYNRGQIKRGMYVISILCILRLLQFKTANTRYMNVMAVIAFTELCTKRALQLFLFRLHPYADMILCYRYIFKQGPK